MWLVFLYKRNVLLILIDFYLVYVYFFFVFVINMYKFLLVDLLILFYIIVFSIGFNCVLGVNEMRFFIEVVSKNIIVYIICYLNVGICFLKGKFIVLYNYIWIDLLFFFI